MAGGAGDEDSFRTVFRHLVGVRAILDPRVQNVRHDQKLKTGEYRLYSRKLDAKTGPAQESPGHVLDSGGRGEARAGSAIFQTSALRRGCRSAPVSSRFSPDPDLSCQFDEFAFLANSSKGSSEFMRYSWVNRIHIPQMSRIGPHRRCLGAVIPRACPVAGSWKVLMQFARRQFGFRRLFLLLILSYLLFRRLWRRPESPAPRSSRISRFCGRKASHGIELRRHTDQLLRHTDRSAERPADAVFICQWSFHYEPSALHRCSAFQHPDGGGTCWHNDCTHQ